MFFTDIKSGKWKIPAQNKDVAHVICMLQQVGACFLYH